MCSNMWARPVPSRGSWAEPALTSVKKEKTGASGRSQIITVMPFANFLTVTRFSKEAMSCAALIADRMVSITASFRMRCFIGPPMVGRISLLKTYVLDGPAGQKFESTWADGGLSNLIASAALQNLEPQRSRRFTKESTLKITLYFAGTGLSGTMAGRSARDRFHHRNSGPKPQA